MDDLRLWDVVPQRVAVEMLGGGEGRRRWLNRNVEPAYRLGGTTFYLRSDLGLPPSEGEDFPNYRLHDLRTRAQMQRILRCSHQWVWEQADTRGGVLLTVNPYGVHQFWVDDGTFWPKRCWGTNQKGGRCTRRYWKRSKYCWQHQGQDE